MTSTDAGVDRDAARVAELLGLPFPGTRDDENDRRGGPGFRVVALRVSQPFWGVDGDLYEALDEVRAHMEERLDALTRDLHGSVGRRDRCRSLLVDRRRRGTGAGGHLSQCCASMRVGPRPAPGRCVALAIGHWDKELPMELLAVLAEPSRLRPLLPEGG